MCRPLLDARRGYVINLVNFFAQLSTPKPRSSTLQVASVRDVKACALTELCGSPAPQRWARASAQLQKRAMSGPGGCSGSDWLR
mmetsp:Transcript_7747/g.23013  ORF Transcript_7747/g.23013 Transcript_7747/m.23013 type:complete len:84 (+) Transcript_7747:428-679(+)